MATQQAPDMALFRYVCVCHKHDGVNKGYHLFNYTPVYLGPYGVPS